METPASDDMDMMSDEVQRAYERTVNGWVVQAATEAEQSLVEEARRLGAAWAAAHPAEATSLSAIYQESEQARARRGLGGPEVDSALSPEAAVYEAAGQVGALERERVWLAGEPFPPPALVSEGAADGDVQPRGSLDWAHDGKEWAEAR